MKKFNLEKAEAGHALITRDGRKVSEFVCLKTEASDAPCVAIINGVPLWCSKDGRIRSGDESPADLFMAPVFRTVYVNLWKGGCGVGFPDGARSAQHYETEEEAQKGARHANGERHLSCIGVAIPVTIEE
jgi:hypothetical protein